MRFASCEPLLGELDIRRWLADGLGWVIAGGESGPGARPMHPDWARSLRDQCLAASVPYFFKLLCTIEVLSGKRAVPTAAYSQRLLARAAQPATALEAAEADLREQHVRLVP